MRCAAPAVLALVGCRFGFDRMPSSDANDAHDGSDAAPTICHSGTWGTPQRVAPPSTPSHESDPTLSLDQREMFYTSNAGATQGYGIWQATRAAATDPFMTGSLVTALDSAYDDFDPSLSADGATLLFTSGPGGAEDIYYAQRPAVGALFGAATPLVVVGDTALRRLTPDLASDGLTLYYAREGIELAYASRAALSDDFVFVRELDEVNVPSTDSTPSITADGLELFFESTRTGSAATYVARRSSPTEQFSAPVELTELVTSVAGATASGGPAISADGTTLYIFLNTGQIDVYVVTRTCN